jgi:cell wall-associated NlpC family hydrolase
MSTSRAASFMGLLTIGFGAWLVDSAVQNRPPIKTLSSILKSPGSMTSVLSSAKGTAYPVATAGNVSTASLTSGGTGGGSAQAQAAVAYARAQIGKPYVYGATGPNSFDCSGLVQAAYKAAGVSLPRTTYQQILVGSPVGKTALTIGDLVFPDVGHVQIYSGNGNVIEAPHTGTNVREVAMWGFMTARRITSTGTVSV